MYNNIAEANRIHILRLLPFHLNFLNLKLNNFKLQTSKNDDTNLKYMYNYCNANVEYDNLLVGSTILEINQTN